MSLVLLFMYLLHELVSDWTDAFVALQRGFVALDRVKVILQCRRIGPNTTDVWFQLSFSRPASIQPSRQPDDVSVKLSIQEAIFKWDSTHKQVLVKENEPTHFDKPLFSLNVQDISITTNSIVGVTGNNKSDNTSFVLALLGHMRLETGDYRRSGAMTYYPEWPYMMDDSSIRQNIIFSGGIKADFDENRYRDALDVVQLHFNKGFDSVPQSNDTLNAQWLQRINLARALYENK